MNANCGTCNLTIRDDEEFVICDCCRSSFHITKLCTIMSSTEYRAVTLQKQRKLIFFCEDCLKIFKQTPLIIKKEPSRLHNLLCYYQNVRGLNTKISTFFSSVSDCEFDIITLSETWLHKDVCSSELIPDSYHVHRKDRKFDVVNENRGGGVLIAVKNTIISESVDVQAIDLNFPLIDMLVVKCEYNTIVNNTANLLDLVISNVQCQVLRDNVPLVREDGYHPALIISIESLSSQKSSTIAYNSQAFWSFVNSKNGTSRIPGKVTYQNTTYENPQDIVNAFGNYFKSVYISPENNDANNVIDSSYFNHLNINVTNISEDEIFKAIKQLKNKMTSGADNIPSFLVKDCAGVLVVPLLGLVVICVMTL
ncbi:hypothetical protein NQ317_004349 [Molorchus minor]|uniref:Uncharacterized protein n=1 Tax=Molorchus minor TaxID=1323400 RepID=A0ABQ9JFU9_9CUCU|nr:hypothetical protein NQ317_004349 [Molorchus minor]